MGTRGEVTREKIIRASRRLLRHQGYSKTSIEEICKESGVKRGNLYFYFKSKEELAVAAIDDSTSRHIPFFFSLMEDEQDPLRRIELMLEGILGFYRARGGNASCLFGNMAQEMGDSNAALAEAADRFFRAWAEMLRNLFEEAKAAGKLKEETDSDALAHLVIGCIEGAILIHKASRDPETFQKTGRALKQVLAGLST